MDVLGSLSRFVGLRHEGRTPESLLSRPAEPVKSGYASAKRVPTPSGSPTNAGGASAGGAEGGAAGACPHVETSCAVELLPRSSDTPRVLLLLVTVAVAAAAVRWWQGGPPRVMGISSPSPQTQILTGPDGQRVARLIQSSSTTGDRLAEKDPIQFVEDFTFSGPTVQITCQPDQEILGFGGAFTEAAALVFQGLPAERQQEVLSKYFGPDGIGFTLGRVHINSCDFSPKNYAFDDVDGDFELEHFDSKVTHDTEAMIPFIRQAQAIIEASGQQLKLLACPWSPPAWMKSNGQMDSSGDPGLKDTCKATWAKYISKWIAAYKDHGVPIWGITPQNEPENNAKWEACLFNAQQEMEWIAGHLGPTIRGDHPEVKIFIFDHNKEDVYDWAEALYSNPDAAQYAAGVAFHWYTGDHFANIAKMRQNFPDATLLASEATYERYRWKPGSTLMDGDWSFGEGYAHDIIGDMNAGATGWIDWNLILDQNGGPNHVDNVCDAAMVAKGDELAIHPQYYAMGHFSKYVLPKSRRLVSSVVNSSTYSGDTRLYGTCTSDDGLEAAAFLRPDGLTAVVVLNCADASVEFKLQDGAQALKGNIPGHGIQTYLFDSSAPMHV